MYIRGGCEVVSEIREFRPKIELKSTLRNTLQVTLLNSILYRKSGGRGQYTLDTIPTVNIQNEVNPEAK